MNCRERIVRGDRGWMRAYADENVSGVAPVHRECDLIDYLGHSFGVCRCAGYDTRSRAAALLLWQRVASAVEPGAEGVSGDAGGRTAAGPAGV